jgi:Arc/MetJ-type ribon-helix-helix transcriptional regulator
MTTSRNPSVALSDRRRRRVDGLVASGRDHGVSEMVGDGIESGPAGALDLDAIVAEAELRAARRE